MLGVASMADDRDLTAGFRRTNEGWPRVGADGHIPPRGTPNYHNLLADVHAENERLADMLNEANEDGFGWKPRALVAEAALARVRDLCDAMGSGFPYVSVHDLRAALDGGRET